MSTHHLFAGIPEDRKNPSAEWRANCSIKVWWVEATLTAKSVAPDGVSVNLITVE